MSCKYLYIYASFVRFCPPKYLGICKYPDMSFPRNLAQIHSSNIHRSPFGSRQVTTVRLPRTARRPPDVVESEIAAALLCATKLPEQATRVANVKQQVNEVKGAFFREGTNVLNPILAMVTVW